MEHRVQRCFADEKELLDKIKRMEALKEIGIYKITSPSGKSYVGMTMDSFHSRWRGHKYDLRGGKHKCAALQRAYFKYGEENLSFEKLEAVEHNAALSFVLKKEQEWWDKLKAQGVSLYNGRPTGTGSVNHTEMTKLKIRETILEKTKLSLAGRVLDARLKDPAGIEFLVKCFSQTCDKAVWGAKNRKFCSKTCSNASYESGFSRISVKELEELYLNKKLSTGEIAKMFEVSQPHVSKTLKAKGIKTRSISEGLKTKKQGGIA